MQVPRGESGFTFIEVVVVVTILAILAAFAVPRFTSLEVEARSAAAQALAGSIRSGSTLSHALWLAQGQPATVSIEGAEITLVNGYPDRESIDDAVADFAGFTYAAETGTFSQVGTAEPCTVTYTEASSIGDAPRVTVDVSGC